MLQYRPWLDKDSPLNKAIDSAYKRGIGLISMKQIAGNFLGDKPHGNILDEVARRVPVLAERKLTPYQGLLQAIWTDERISAVCTTMRNTDHIRENTDAAGRYEPLKQADIHQLRDATLAHGSMLCADCDGRCSVAAGTRAELGNLTRFLTYHEHHGDRTEARRLYAELLPEARDWSAPTWKRPAPPAPTGSTSPAPAPGGTASGLIASSRGTRNGEAVRRCDAANSPDVSRRPDGRPDLPFGSIHRGAGAGQVIRRGVRPAAISPRPRRRRK